MSQALQRASRSLRERWWLILVCMVLCTGIGFIYLFLAERIYAATAVVQYNADRDDVFELPDLSSEINLDRQLARFDRQRLNNYRDMLFSDALLQGVVAAGKLGEDPDFAPLAESAQRTRADLAEQLAQWVDVEIPASGGFLNITVRHPNPEMAAQLANSLAEELIRNDSASKEERIRSEIERLKMVMDAATKEVSQSGEGLAESQQDSVSRRAQRELDLQRLSDLSQRQIAATLRRIGIESECQRIAQAGTNVEELLKVPLVASDPNVAAIRASIILANVELERLLRRVKSGHPEYQRKVAELDALARQLEEAIGAAVEGARQNLEREQLQEKSLSEQYEKLSQEIRQNAQVNLADADQVLKQRLEVMVTLRGRILDGIKAATLRMSFLDSPLGIHQKAQPPTTPAEPQAARITTLGLVGGLILGLVLALALGLVDTSLRSLEETERFLSFPVLSALPRIESLEGPPSPVVVDPEAHFAAAEGFRSLRTSIAVLNKERPIQCILFTSAAPGEGKSFCALNLAASLAQQGHRTLLIESDLRRPILVQSLPYLRDDRPGLAEYLRQHAELQRGRREAPVSQNPPAISFAELRRKQGAPAGGNAPREAEGGVDQDTSGALHLNSITQSTNIPSLFAVPAGEPSTSSSELLGQERVLKGLLADARRRYDRVVIDSAPLLGVSDALLLASQADATCLVIRAHRTPRAEVQRAVRMLQRAAAPVVGTILNGLAASESDYYSDYYYYVRAPEDNVKSPPG